MARLRGHHLICLNFFKGEGYSKDFVENLYRILEDNQISVVFGADDVCEVCPYFIDDRCCYTENSEEEITELDQFAYKILGIFPGERTSWNEIRERLKDVIDSWREFACKSCDWKEVCEK